MYISLSPLMSVLSCYLQALLGGLVVVVGGGHVFSRRPLQIQFRFTCLMLTVCPLTARQESKASNKVALRFPDPLPCPFLQSVPDYDSL